MASEKPKTGKYRLGSAFLWAAALGGIAWFLEEGFWRSLGAAAGGWLAGWTTAAFLGRFAKWGAGPRVLIPLGLVLGVTVASGAVAGLGWAINWFHTDAVEVNWEDLGKYVLSGAALPAAALGIVTAIYVRRAIPPRKPE